MSKYLRERGRAIARRAAVDAVEVRQADNSKMRELADREYREFAETFKQGVCCICREPLDAFVRHKPCVHWLLRPIGFTKADFLAIPEAGFGIMNIQAWLRDVANQEAFARNINDIAEEGSGKMIECTIRYRDYDWSFSCGESDFMGHESKQEASRRPHYHFQMRAKKQRFIAFNDFHVPLSDRDIMLLEAQRSSNGEFKLRFGGPAMSDLLDERVLPEMIANGLYGGDDPESAHFQLSTMIVADEGSEISGDDLADLFEEAKEKGVTVTSLIHKLGPHVSATTLVTAGDGVVEQAVRSGGRGKERGNSNLPAGPFPGGVMGSEE